MTLSDLSTLHWTVQCSKTKMRPDYVPRKVFSDKTANGLTNAITTFLNISGWRADRISSAGRYIDDSKVVTDVLGHVRKIGSGKFVKSQTRNGYADINATIKGRSVMIEVKMKDRVSEAQLKFAEAERNAGGQYWVVRSWPEFWKEYNTFINQTT